MLLYPSLMGANQLTLGIVIDQLEPFCAGFHLDTMDGHAVPNITGGPHWINAIAAYSKKPVWVHFMTSDPMLWIDALKLRPGSMVDFQHEAPIKHQAVLNAIKKKGLKAGISISPQTSIDTIKPLLAECDYVTIMGVNPGFSGQTYVPETTTKIKALQTLIQNQKLSCAIACDGGITEALIPTLAELGVTHCAVASALFNAPDPVAVLKKYHT